VAQADIYIYVGDIIIAVLYMLVLFKESSDLQYYKKMLKIIVSTNLYKNKTEMCIVQVWN